MPNGFGLNGNNARINTALIIPFINDSTKYYLFTSNGIAIGTNFIDTLKYSFSIVDMQLNGGLGDVTNKNTFIKGFAAEKMVAILNANGNDIWWICRDWTNKFYSYKINCIGFQNNNPTISTVGNNLNNDLQLVAAGDIKASTDGKYIAACYRNYFEVYKFNNVTGVLSNPIKIPTEYCSGIEFSSNSKVLYVTQSFLINSQLYYDIVQYSLLNYDSSLISSSLIKITNAQSTGNGYGYLGCIQLSSNGKIYNSDLGYNYLRVINNPNLLGVSSNFQDSVLALVNPSAGRLPYSYVNLITAQNVQISYTVAPDCRTVTFNAKTYIKGNNLTFKWKWGEPPPLAGTAADSATQVVPSGGDTTYTTITHTYPPGIDTFFVGLTVNSDTLCGTGRAGIKVIVKPPKPTANFGFAATCNSLNVVFTDSSRLNFNPSLSYQYAFKAALALPAAYTNFSTAPNNNYTFSSYDSFDVRLIVRSPLGCVQADTIIKRIVLKAKPIAACSYTNTCGSLAVNVTNSSSIAAGSITSYKYFVGNTLIASTPAFSYSFAAYGSYTIKQVVQSNFGCVSDTFFLPVVVKDKPVTILSFINDSLCTNTAFTITSNASVNAATVTNYFWQINTGAVQNLSSNTRTDNFPTGIYNYKHWVRSSQACESDTVYQTITVVSKPTATITAINNCGSRQININSSTNVINDNITTHYVDYGDGNIGNANPNNTAYTYTNYGSYTIKYVAKSSVGCAADTAFFPIVVKDKPAASIAYNNDACKNTNFVLTVTSTVAASNIINYTWIRNGVVLTNTTNQLTQNQPAGSYEYKLVARAANGCSSDTVIQNVVVEQYPTTAFTAAGGCVGNSIVITNSSTSNNTGGSLTYAWATSDGQASTAVVPAFSFATSGPKTITLSTTTQNGCATPLTKNITVDAFP
ncbi:MAG: hypothetical protein H7334_06410, partial [Ferruginibacter sp.]|nr:hypothetical protein [Ferruginibacter sp.]